MQFLTLVELFMKLQCANFSFWPQSMRVRIEAKQSKVRDSESKYKTCGQKLTLNKPQECLYSTKGSH